MSERELLNAAAHHAAKYLEGLPERRVEAESGSTAMRDAFRGDLPDRPTDPRLVLDHLVATAEPGITAMGSPRYFGLVVGGTLPAALAADWLASTWDQNALLARSTPAVAALEETTGQWFLDVLKLPVASSFAFVTGCQMAHVTALAAARHEVLARAGWNVEEDGLIGAPPIRVIVGGERHVTIDRALRVLGLGVGCIEAVAVDSRGAMNLDALEAELRHDGRPTIVCAQLGNVNTGAIDPIAGICELAHDVNAWVHVDGAFGLWANASPTYRHLIAGSEYADSWATDAHMILNVPYDCGFAAVSHRSAHEGSMKVRAPFFLQDEPIREPLDWTPESSRRARAIPAYAALLSLGKQGLAELVDRLFTCAERFAVQLGEHPRLEVLASGLNQALIRAVDGDAVTDQLVHEIQKDGTCWMSPSTWQGRRCIRISVCNWRTTEMDVDRSIDAITAALARL
ncbi:aminotransferase class V-fold PLP-dependent enzyme [Microbispora sp. KK1-11]|uniref:pyridoxal phosphate-dependent decarboxylase family protein n=1 Tax=Microbispora sp. KK1-11 TaxID=2053005 RepID=UPI001C8E3201|nr:aminotransferase class V-fold PLP-dependent enzyme [Microbispora sp. KK1-11]